MPPHNLAHTVKQVILTFAVLLKYYQEQEDPETCSSLKKSPPPLPYGRGLIESVNEGFTKCGKLQNLLVFGIIFRALHHGAWVLFKCL